MEDQPQTARPISDDQELAKVLAGVSNGTEVNLNFEETPVSQPAADEADKISAIDDNSTPANDLDGIKKDALIELRPLIDKLDILPEEKFDIYLLLLRSTDDKTLIAPAHETARSISDESRRAQALLDVIKEIDFLSNPPEIK